MSLESTIYTYEYVDKFIKEIEKENRVHKEKIEDTFDIIARVGIDKAMRSGDIKKIRGRKEPVYELRISTMELEYRFMGARQEDSLYFVHAFIKKTRKTDKREIDKTIKRLKKYKLI